MNLTPRDLAWYKPRLGSSSHSTAEVLRQPGGLCIAILNKFSLKPSELLNLSDNLQPLNPNYTSKTIATQPSSIDGSLSAKSWAGDPESWR